MLPALPLISVIIPCYNYAAYLPEAIDSIEAQTYQNWEIIIVDDGSVDDTAVVAKRYTMLDKRIHYFYQRNKGLSAARNTGIAQANGKYLQFLDADDYLAPTKMQLQVPVLEANPTIDLVYGDTYNFSDTTSAPVVREFRKLNLQIPPISGQGQELAMHMAYDNIFLVSNPLLRKSLANRVGEFNEQLFSLEDWHFWYRGVLLGAKHVHDNQPGTEFYVRTHGSNMSGNRHKMWKYRLQARQLFIDLIRDKMASGDTKGLMLKPLLAKQVGLFHEEQARFNLLYTSVGKGLLHTMQCFLHGNKPVRIWYDSAYWLKERLLGRNKVNS